jgi:hypothetical protein
MQNTRSVLWARAAGAVMIAVLTWVVSASTGLAQFGGLPKIPKLPKKNTTTSQPATKEVNPSHAGTMEVASVSAMTPDSAPPGGHGQVALTGTNFKPGMTLRFNCKGASFDADSVKVESATKVVAQISVPVTAQEGSCSTSARSASGKDPFQISNSANMPIAVSAVYIGEGDMQFMDMMMKMQQAMMPGYGKQGGAGQITLDSGSIKYVQDGQPTFTESISSVKSMGEMKQNGNPVGIFRIVFNDGKIYNFSGSGSVGNSHAVFEFLQKKLGK